MATITEMKNTFIAAWNEVSLTDTEFRNLVLNEIVKIYEVLIVIDNNQTGLDTNQQQLNNTINQLTNKTSHLIDKQIMNLSRNISNIQKRLGGK